MSTISHEEVHDNEVMVSFDVESFFTNVPIGDAVQALLRKLENDSDLANRTNLTPTRISNITGRFRNSKTEQLRESLFLRLKPKSTWKNLRDKR